MHLTNHAQRRWDQRFSGLDPNTEWLKARRIGRKLRAALRDNCPAHAHLVKGHIVGGVYYRYTAGSQIMWVVNLETDGVITVFRIDPTIN